MSYPIDRMLDERPTAVDCRFEAAPYIGKAEDAYTDMDVTYTPDPTSRDGWKIEIENSCWKALVVGEDLEKGKAGMVELQLTELWEGDGVTVGQRDFAELTWPATPRSQN